MVLRKYFCFILFVAAVGQVHAQTIENVRSVFQNNKVTLYYDIVNAKVGQSFSIQVYSSHNGYSTPLTYLSGDVGHHVKPGASKKIEWDVQGELKSYTGDITLEVRAEIVLAWLFLAPKSGSGGVRRGKNVAIMWQGGVSTDNVKLEYLYEGKPTLIGETKNVGSLIWSVPKDLPKGEGYELRLTSGGQSTTENFIMKSKLPLLLKLSPLALVGVGALLFLPNKIIPEGPLPEPGNP